VALKTKNYKKEDDLSINNTNTAHLCMIKKENISFSLSLSLYGNNIFKENKLKVK